MADKTITAANSVFTLAIGSLFPVPQKLQGYAADTAFTVDPLENKELVMGVDGNMSVGYVFAPSVVTINIMPDSPSLLVFDAWQAAEKIAREAYLCSAVVIIPSIGRKYALTKGALTSAPSMVSAQRVLGAQQFRISFQSIIGEPY